MMPRCKEIFEYLCSSELDIESLAMVAYVARDDFYIYAHPPVPSVATV